LRPPGLGAFSVKYVEDLCGDPLISREFMKKIGIIGGVGPEATIEYYRLIINYYREKITDGSYPEIIINSINITSMIGFIEKNDKTGLISYLSESVKSLADAGADIALIASNTPHLVFEELAEISGIPLVSIVEETCASAKNLGLKKAGLLGTAFTMNNRFYHKVFGNKNIEIITPDDDSKQFIHSKIFGELVSGIIKDDTRKKFIEIIDRMKTEDGIDCLILGCTELPLILTESDGGGIPFLNTTAIHAKGIVDRII
jgi:aspartate racemase